MLRISVIITLLFVAFSASAADRYWIGALGSLNNWNDTAKWSTTSGGTGGASVPGSADKAIFDGNGLGNCTVNATVNIAGIDVQSGYTGTISQGSNTITVGTSNAVFSGGTFSGGSANISVSGTFTLSGTSFTSTSGTMTITSNYTFSSGSFAHNNGTVKIQATTCTLTGSTTFYTLNLSGVSSSTINVAAGTIITVTYDLQYTGSGSITFNSGTIEAEGNITLSNTSNTGGGAGTIKINGTGKQTLTGPLAGVNTQSRLPNVEIDKTSDTLVLADFICVAGNWKYTQGIIDSETDSSTIFFVGTKTIEGTHTLYNVSFAGGTYTITDTLTVAGTLKTTSSGNIIMNTGSIIAMGDITLNSTGNGNGGGTATIKINGTGDQTLTGPTVGYVARLCSIVIDKSAGTLYLANIITVTGNWTYTQGTIDAGTSTVIFHTGKTISGTHTLYNVRFVGGIYTITGTLTVAGSLVTEDSGNIIMNTGSIIAMGNITLNSTGNGNGGGTATIKINGTGDQTLTGPTTAYIARLCSIIIDKPSGTLHLANIITVTGSWTYTQGTIDAGTSTVIFHTGKTISGTHTLYNVRFTGGTFTITGTLTVAGTLVTEDTGDIVMNTGSIIAMGNITLSNTGNGIGGTATVYISGTGDQTLTGSGISTAGRLCNVVINKSSGVLTLKSNISANGSWTYQQGDVEASINTSTVTFLGSASIDAQGTSSTMIFCHVVFINGTRTIAGELNATGNLTISTGATLTNTSYPVAVGGNWSNSGTYNRGTSTVTFNGTGTQTVIKSGATETFYGLAVNKSSGSVTLNGPVTVTHALTLTSGEVTTTSTNLLTLNNGATSTAGSDTSFVSGPMKKIGNAAFTFPLGGTSGGASYYHPLGITAPSSSTDAFTAEYIAAGYPNDSVMVDSLEYISDCEYWVITRVTGTSNVTATVGWNANSCVLSNFADMILTQWDGAKWASLGSSDIFVDTDKGTLKASFPVDFAVAGPKNLTIGVAKNKSPYAELKHKLDGGYYIAYNGKLLFKYDEEYNDTDSKLTFNIYDEDQNLVGANTFLPTGQQKPVSAGDNRYVINLINCYINLGNGFYVLEVINEKNEKRYLRFKHQTSISIACPPSGPSPM